MLAALLLAFSPLAAQAAGLVAPNAGSILQQVQPLMPQAPSSTGTGLTIEQEGGAKLPPSSPFEVKSIQITGNALFDSATLHALVADAEGKTLTLPALDELAGRITDYYHGHGYPLARAFIPAQTIKYGMVRIEVIEARYGKILLDNRSRAHGDLLEATLSSLQGGQLIGQEQMDHALLLLSDVPGVEIEATLKPGESVGTSDLLVETKPGPAVSGNASLDDFGNRYTGRGRAGGTVTFANPLHHGDTLSFSGLSSGKEMNYMRVAYDSLLNGPGTRMGASYSSLNYVLGDTLASLDGHGSAQVSSLWAKHPLLRSRELNLYGQIQFDQMVLRDHLDTTSIRTDRHLNNWTASLSGDGRDTRLSADAITTWNVGWTSGAVVFDDGTAGLADASTAKTRGGFQKLNVSLARLQSLGQRDALYLSFAAQQADGNLDSSQKMAVGGPYTVRAYDMGAVSGDTGYLLGAEFRHELGQAWLGQWQAVAFADSASLAVNKYVWVAGTNSATLSGVGAGVNWTGPQQWSAKAYVAAPVGATPALVGATSSARAWVEIGKGF